MKIQNILLIGMVFFHPFVAVAEEKVAKNQDKTLRARLDDVANHERYEKAIDASYDVYHSFVKGAHGEVPSSILRNTRCIAVLPDVVTGALVVGGTYGSGFASCIKKDNTWSQPAAISLTQGSIGLQAGGKSSDLLLLIQSEKGERALKQGEFAIGTDLSAVAGKFDTQVDTSNVDVIAYSRTSGLFAGASVNGSTIKKDDGDLERYYGKDVDYIALLEGRIAPDGTRYSERLTNLFPNY